MRCGLRRNVKWIAYLISGLFFIKLFIMRKEFENERESQSQLRAWKEIQIDGRNPVDADDSLFQNIRDKENEKKNNDMQKNFELEVNDIEPESKNLLKVVVDESDRKRSENPPKITPADQETDDNEIFLKEMEQVYRQRKEQVQQMCDQLGRNVSYGSLWLTPLRRMRWLNSHKIIMCFNAKVGTSTWTQYLMQAGYPGLLEKTTHWHSTAERLLRPPSSRGSSSSIALMETYGKIMIVRDPFARIVSAYFDKITRRRSSKTSRYIIRRYRNKESEVKLKYPTFLEFVMYLVEFTPIQDDIRLKRDHRTNRHWFHYYANCAPCDIHYDVIATMESAKDDTRYIINKYKLGLKDDIWNNHFKSKSSEETAITLFQSIPCNLTMALYQRYRIDFLMFGYSFEKYLGRH